MTPFPEAMRKLIGKKRGWKCQYPGCNRAFRDGYYLEVHHRNPTSAGGADTEDNAEILCIYHHYVRHLELEVMGIGHNSTNIVKNRWERKGDKFE